MAKNRVKEDEKIVAYSKKKLIKRLFAYMKPYKKQIIQTLLLTTFIIVVDLLNPYYMKMGLDYFIPENKLSLLLIIGICVLGANLLSMFCFKGRINIMLTTSNKILMTIRQDLYTHIQELSFSFFDSRPTGKILARIIGDVNSLKDLFNTSVTQLIPNLVKMGAALIIMFIFDYKLTLISMAMLPVLVVGMALVEIKGHKLWQKFRQKNSNLNAYTHENFSGIRVVQGFAAEEKTLKHFEGLLGEHKKSFIHAILLGNLFWPLVELSWGVSTVVVFVYGITSLRNGGDITVGTLVMFTAYLSMFWHPVMQISNFYNTLITNMAGAERIFEILDVAPEIKDKEEAKEMPHIIGSIKFDKVQFEYDKDIPVLHEINLDVEAGETIALVGPTGAGKSTIVHLISRFYEPTKGIIRIDGMDISQATIESLRSQMGIMTQDTFLFSGTIKDNIAYGKLGATDGEIIAAAKAVNAHDFIMKFEKGYDTPVNEQGSRLSVGQRQLIAFARTMLSDPKILILDEATSSIDTQTEKMVQQGIESLLQDRTSFVIAHRLSTIEHADRILVIDDGEIKESGSHKELLDQKGIYYNLFMVQVKSISA